MPSFSRWADKATRWAIEKAEQEKVAKELIEQERMAKQLRDQRNSPKEQWKRTRSIMRGLVRDADSDIDEAADVGYVSPRGLLGTPHHE